jgi:hypothetical protein
MAQSDGQQLAHFNWALMRAPYDDPLVAEFANANERVNAIAERSPGFVWRHGDVETAGRAIGWPLFAEAPTMIASFSVWETPAALETFVHRTVHGAFVKRGAEWFERGGTFNHVLWWVEAGHVPGIGAARRSVERLMAEGPGAAVFTLSSVPEAAPE